MLHDTLLPNYCEELALGPVPFKPVSAIPVACVPVNSLRSYLQGFKRKAMDDLARQPKKQQCWDSPDNTNGDPGPVDKLINTMKVKTQNLDAVQQKLAKDRIAGTLRELEKKSNPTAR